MTQTIIQRIKRTDHAEYELQLELPDGNLITRSYTRSNEIFPAYKTLGEVLRKYDGVGIHVETNCLSLVAEFNTVQSNPNSRLLNELHEIIARRGLSVTIAYAE